jgi:hypothetical protein
MLSGGASSQHASQPPPSGGMLSGGAFKIQGRLERVDEGSPEYKQQQQVCIRECARPSVYMVQLIVDVCRQRGGLNPVVQGSLFVSKHIRACIHKSSKATYVHAHLHTHACA